MLHCEHQWLRFPQVFGVNGHGVVLLIRPGLVGTGVDVDVGPANKHFIEYTNICLEFHKVFRSGPKIL